jgi:rSAM/selenodomain-associated transferase 1
MTEAANAILVFAKAPQAGKVKTRLIPALGVEGATSLYRSLLERRLDSLPHDDASAIQLWCTPDCRHPLLQSRAGLSLHAQQGSDLGQRMAHAASQALRHYHNIVLIGIDCPALTPSMIGQAFDWLESGCDAVLGPAEDGGYVLLGLRQVADCLFDDLPWGTSLVADKTRACMSELGWKWRELPELWDLDRPEDLPRLKALGRDLPDGS